MAALSGVYQIPRGALDRGLQVVELPAGRHAVEDRSLLHLAEERHEERLEAMPDLAQGGQARALEDLDEEQLEPRPVPVHEVLHVAVVEARDLLLHPDRPALVAARLELAQRLDEPGQAVAEAHRLLQLRRE